jgi:hypothetical protein
LMERNWLNSPEASMDNPLGRIYPLYAAAACLWSQLSKSRDCLTSEQSDLRWWPEAEQPATICNRSACCGTADQFRPAWNSSQLDAKPTSRLHSVLMFASRAAVFVVFRAKITERSPWHIPRLESAAWWSSSTGTRADFTTSGTESRMRRSRFSRRGEGSDESGAPEDEGSGEGTIFAPNRRGALTVRPSRKPQAAEVFANRLDVARPHQARARSVSVRRSHQFEGGIAGRRSSAPTSR